jgi:hypothetical protein
VQASRAGWPGIAFVGWSKSYTCSNLTFIFFSLPAAFFLGEILPNFNLNNMILTYTKDFPWKK